MNDIKIVQKPSVDYIPEDGILCRRCKFYDWCPVDYICKSLDRQLNDEFGEGEEE